MPASIYKFAAPASFDFEIVQASNDEKVGELRVKSSSLLWKPKNAKGDRPYYSATMDEVVEFIKSKDRRVSK